MRTRRPKATYAWGAVQPLGAGAKKKTQEHVVTILERIIHIPERLLRKFSTHRIVGQTLDCSAPGEARMLAGYVGNLRRHV